MPDKSNTSFTELPVSTDIQPGRRLRGPTVVTDPNPTVGTRRGKAARKKAAKLPRRTGSPHRTANEEAGAQRRGQKRANTRRIDKKGIAERAVAKKGADSTAVAKKMTVREGGTKGSLGGPTLAKKRSAARRTITAKLATRKVVKTKRSAAGRAKTSTSAPKAAKRRARRNR